MRVDYQVFFTINHQKYESGRNISIKSLIRASTLFTGEKLTVNKVKLIFNILMYLCYQGRVTPD